MNRFFCFGLAIFMFFQFSFFSLAILDEEYYMEAIDGDFYDDESVFSSVAVSSDGVIDLNITSKAVILLEPISGKIVYEKNSNEHLPMASVTKVMTLLLIMEAIDSGKINMDDMVVASANASSMGGSQIFLKENEEMSVQDMLKSIVVSSANDCAVAMAEHISGSVDLFVDEMNKKAKELGMNDTCFVNPTGLDVEGHYSSANDIALMSRELIINHPKILDYTTIWMDTVRDGEFGLANTNKLLRTYKGADGLKTGSTSNALYCLSATAQRDGLRFIAVVLGAESSKIRFSEASTLLDYGFANFKSQIVAFEKENYGEVIVTKGDKGKVSCGVLEDTKVLVDKSVNGKLVTDVKFNDKIEAPVKMGDKVGEMIVKFNDKKLATINLVAKENIDKITYSKIYISFCKLFFNIC